jgi:hypothetical protein
MLRLTSKRHGAACCVTSTRPSLTRTAPARGVGSGLESMRNETVPVPCPCADDVIAAHATADEADHEHSAATLTVTALVPPSGPNVRLEAAKLGWHRGDAVVGEVTVVVADPPQPNRVAPDPRTMTTTRENVLDLTGDVRDAHPSPAWSHATRSPRRRGFPFVETRDLRISGRGGERSTFFRVTRGLSPLRRVRIE